MRVKRGERPDRIEACKAVTRANVFCDYLDPLLPFLPDPKVA